MISLRKLLLPEHAQCSVQGGSKKRTLEYIATLISQHDPDVDFNNLLRCLIRREKLGSTGLGSGVAIPHCRLPSCKKTIAVFLQLAEPIDFDAIDRHKVDLLFALVVPDDSINEHLELLKKLAEKFSNALLCQALRQTESSETLYQLITNEESSPSHLGDEIECQQQNKITVA